MSLTAKRTPMAAREFALLEEAGKVRLELIRGVVREMPRPEFRHARTTNRIQYLLTGFADRGGLGTVVADMGFLIERDPDTVRAPDCAFLRAGRLPDPAEEGFFPGPPDLAVEVRSPGDRPGEIRDKIGLWLAAGAHAAWEIDPRERRVTIHLPALPPSILGESDLLDGGDILPGFQVAVRDLFR